MQPDHKKYSIDNEAVQKVTDELNSCGRKSTKLSGRQTVEAEINDQILSTARVEWIPGGG